MAYRVLKLVPAFVLCTLFTYDSFAQFAVQHQAPIAFERVNPTELNFNVPGLTQNDVQQAILYYRYDGDFAYQQKEIEYYNGAFTTFFEVGNQSAGTIEYYLEITLIQGEKVFYPGGNASEDPVQVEIVEKLEEKERKRLEEIDFTILSPSVGAGVSSEDVFIALALFYDPSLIEAGEFRLLIDNIDVTEDADTSAFYISHVPTGLRSGAHTVTLNYITENENYLVTEWKFHIVRQGQDTYQAFEPRYMPKGQAELSARNQVIAGDVNNAYTGRTRMSGAYGKLKYSLNSYFTSQESSRLQPQNRYGLRMELEDIWKFDAGHVYPEMSRFTISGRRVHGINTSLHLLNEGLNFQFIHGELDRKIDNIYSSFDVEPITSSSGDTVDTRYTLNYENRGKGSFKRKIVGGRIGFGNPEKFQLGLHALKVQDDTASLSNIRNYNDLLTLQPNLGSNLSSENHSRLQENPDLLEIQSGSLRPRDNLVAGTDLKMGFLDNQIRFESEVVLSALNDNIYGGAFSVERAEELGFDINQQTEDLLQQLSWLIIVNENMNTIPIRLSDEDGDNGPDFFFPTSILAGNSEFSMRFPRNNFRMQYRWIGPNFNSLANSTVRKDVAGLTISDRVNLLSNRLYITLGFEHLKDNVVGNRDATTQTLTYRTNASWYPISRKLPRVSLGFRYRTRDNSVERFNPYVAVGHENAAVQNHRIAANGDTLTTTTPRLNNTFNINSSITQQISFLEMVHDLSLNFSNMNTLNEAFAYGDVKSSSVSLNMTSRFSDLPLRTQFGISLNNTETGSGQSTFKIFGIYAGGNYFMLDDRLSLSGRLAVTNNKAAYRNLEISNEGDNFSGNDYYFLGAETAQPAFSTFAIQAGAQYSMNESHVFIFDANLTNVSNANMANDRIVQLRYVFRF